MVRLVLFILSSPDGSRHETPGLHLMSVPALTRDPIMATVYTDLTQNWPLIGNYSPNNVYVVDLASTPTSAVHATVAHYAATYELEAFELASYHDKHTLVWTLYKPFKTRQKRRAMDDDDEAIDARSKRMNLMLI